MGNHQRSRLAFIDALRGLAFVFMVLNHTAIYLLDGSFSPYRQELFYVTVTLAAPLFLFLSGFSIAISGRDQSGMPKTFEDYLTKGLFVIAIGYALTAVIAPDKPIFTGGILQTIGLGMIFLAPFVRYMKHRACRYALLALAVTLYVVFVYAHPTVIKWLQLSPLLMQMLFDGFPPWPWIGVIMFGLVLGSEWQMGPLRNRKLAAKIGAVAAVCLISYITLGYRTGTLTTFNFTRDFIINYHWLPRPVTILWILGALLVNFIAVYFLVEIMKWRLTWLRWFGRSALLLYVAHLLLISVIGKRIMEISLDSWWQFAAVNLLLLASLLLLVRAVAWWRGQTRRKIQIG